MTTIIRSCGALAIAGLLLGACAGMSPTEQRVLSGGAIGAGGGAVLGAIGGNAGLGAVLGGAAGLAGGYLWDQHKQAEEDAYYRGYNERGRRPPRR
ncbi:MAG: hypothetical protein IT561_28120 [Alphaproteobacteria bacterium]|nr:hypothetical protein [Alphaproteobacteria bacterium]